MTHTQLSTRHLLLKINNRHPKLTMDKTQLLTSCLPTPLRWTPSPWVLLVLEDGATQAKDLGVIIFGSSLSVIALPLPLTHTPILIGDGVTLITTISHTPSRSLLTDLMDTPLPHPWIEWPFKTINQTIWLPISTFHWPSITPRIKPKFLFHTHLLLPAFASVAPSPATSTYIHIILALLTCSSSFNTDVALPGLPYGLLAGCSLDPNVLPLGLHLHLAICVQPLQRGQSQPPKLKKTQHPSKPVACHCRDPVHP